MNIDSKFVRATVVAAGAGLSMAVAQPSFAQTIASITGGSSALLGTFAVSGFHDGAIPSVIGNLNANIHNYKTAGESDFEFLAGPVTVTVPASGGNITETVGTAEIRYVVHSDHSISVIVLLRSDSGIGLRYVTNNAFINTWSTFTTTTGGTITDTSALAVIAYLQAHQGDSTIEAIDTGLADVTLHTILNYGPPAGINTANAVVDGSSPEPFNLGESLSNLGPNNASVTGPLIKQTLPADVWLNLYNSSSSSLDLSQSDVQNLVAGITEQGLTSQFIRESTSGTRLTGFLSIPFSTEGGTVKTSTGAVLSAVDSTTDSYGYAFVTGTAGNNRLNTKVAAYSHIAPSSHGNTLPSPYPSTPWWDGVLDALGTHVLYPLWSYANAYSLKGTSGQLAFADIAASLNGGSFDSEVHKEGFISLGDLVTGGGGGGVTKPSTGFTDTNEWSSDGNAPTD